MGKFQNRYVEIKKQDTKENLLYDSIYVEFGRGKIICDDRCQKRSWAGVEWVSSLLRATSCNDRNIVYWMVITWGI